MRKGMHTSKVLWHRSTHMKKRNQSINHFQNGFWFVWIMVSGCSNVWRPGTWYTGFSGRTSSSVWATWRHIYSSSLNLLENWSSRLEDTLNLHTILCHRSKEVHGPVDIIDSLYGLKHDCFSSMTIFSSLSEIMALNLSISLLFSSCAGES